MASRSVDVNISANTRQAERELRRLKNSADDVDDSLGEVESAGQAMAREIERAADRNITEIDAMKRAVDALGSELDDLDVDPRQLVADLRRVGLTAEEIEADAEALAAALRRAGDVQMHADAAGFDDLDQALGRTTDHSRVASTAIGGIGNSISELPGVGSLGPVAESMGMLAENALEGEANLKGLVLAGGGLAAVGLAVKVVQGHFEGLAAIDAFNTAQVDDWTEAIYEAEDAVNGLVDAYRNAGQVEVQTLTDGIVDVTSTLARAGITVDDWTEAVAGGREETERLADKLDIAGVSGGQATDVIAGLAIAQDNYKEATARAEQRTRVFGSETANAAREARLLANELNNTAGDYLVSISMETRAANAALDDLINKLNEIGSSASAASIVAANRFNTGQRSAGSNVTVYAPAGTDISDLSNQAFRRDGRPS